ncbi:uracil-DNA glycosylase family protein [Rhodospirillum rubrum]|uniref:Uracil-DNA glycosylase superfamily n=1 Tax=Rhodospirillum rubrum (strain ATCC 11170 / ATH 1.1.1 / DSM 467 / LMG 4362 / NCIMB 8255 / S1) TaxID=269796 RepID=Q2RN57_RHORT|nr:uracil-DNA glycosylase family protein [Rhodospirillum rubrum]ABC24438.1 Uracil-DNA glycosylase superfamily [Rhodospirillum rubrum ATCC 11170]AEO50189.1 uracil-DNA glycosylase superfamily protein [Rhodospirillum rubrum F11]MBK5956158.1 uracil-DNA glycosylase [Rhodospirillum rubrum]QXG80360.1 uracil-DNA glycosylase family protein [Rhodospirillum rubrum]HAP98828.1 uracil-DNA glycosylase [Rhodospirillum rubrum]
MTPPDAEAEAALAAVVARAEACTLCAAHLPLGPRPVFRVSVTARLLIVGQAPGTRVHATGIPWNDASGDRLRAWMGVDRETFYDARRIAVVPTGLCYPGRLAKGGDAPPRPDCAPLWQPAFRAVLPGIALTLLVGGYAQGFYLGRRDSMTERVHRFDQGDPAFFPLPHPSWRNTAWINRHPWFEAEVLPALRERVAALL